MVGTVSSWFPALTLGIKAGIFALANLAPNECAEIQEAYEAGDLKSARATYMRVFPVNTAVTATYGVSGLKYASDRMGYQGGSVRSPLLPVNETEKKVIVLFKKHFSPTDPLKGDISNHRKGTHKHLQPSRTFIET